MQMPRFTIRAMTVAVAMTALALGARELHARGREYRSKADHHRFIEEGGRGLLRAGEQRTTLFDCSDIPPRIRKLSSDELGHLSKVVEHHRKLRSKYSRAARYPWLPVAPDPPLPK